MADRHAATALPETRQQTPVQSLVMSLGKLMGDRLRDYNELDELSGDLYSEKPARSPEELAAVKEYRHIEARKADAFSQLDAAHELLVRLDAADASEAAIIAGNALGFLYQIEDDVCRETADLDLKRDFARAVAGLEAVTRFLVAETKIDPVAYGISYYCGLALADSSSPEVRS